MKYQYAKVTFQEIPDEITLCIAISGCEIHCKDCNQKSLWKDEGKELTREELNRLINSNKGISCVCFMGDGKNMAKLWYYTKIAKEKLDKRKAEIMLEIESYNKRIEDYKKELKLEVNSES